jgi:DNA end-binding protein Ku
MTPLKYLRWCPTCKKEVAWKDIKKGFKISKDRWVILEKEEIEKIKLPSTKTIDIQQFVDISQIDPIYFEKAYYVVPEETGIKPYSLFVEALRLANKAAIGKVVLKNKEYLVCLRPFRKGLAMHILYYIREIRDIDELSELKNLVVVSKEELELAKALISKLTEEEFDPAKFKDQYTEALKELIKAKAEGKEFEVKAEEKVAEAKSLMEALKASVETVKKKKKVE